MSSIFEKPFNEALANYREASGGYPAIPALPEPNDGLQLRRMRDFALGMVQHSAELAPERFTFDFQAVIDAEIAPMQDMYDGMRAQLQAEHDQAVSAKQRAYSDAVQSAEQKAAASTSDLESAYNELLSYKDRISDAIIRYNIKPSDMSLDEDSLTREDMEALVQTALSSCKRLGDSKIRQGLKTLYTPLGDDKDTRIQHCIALGVGFVVLAPVILVALMGYMVWNLSSIYRHVDGLRIADKLMFGIDFSRFRDAVDMSSITAVDTSEDDAELTARLEMAEGYNPQVRADELSKELSANFDKFQQQIEEANSSAMKAYADWLASMNNFKEVVCSMYDEFLANRKDFCDLQSTSFALNYDAVVGLVDETVEVKQTLFDKNIIFANREQMMLDFQRLLLANMLLNVRPQSLEITIYDPERLGQDYTPFLLPDTKNYIHVETKRFDDILDAHRLYSQKNFATLDSRSITDFNVEAEEKLMVTLPYKLLFIATPDKNLYKNQAFLQFIATSVRSGVHVWMVGDSEIPGTTFYDIPFKGVDSPYPVTSQLIAKAVATNVRTTVKDNGILYIPSFQERYLPKEKWWTYNTDKGIDFHLGLANGDPSKGYPITLSDMPVHGLCGGATGAGKSAFINQLLATLVTKYPPSALDLILIDFKNIEFPSLKDHKTNISRIPHASVLAGTKDGEYVLSVFQYLLKDMEERNIKFTEVGAKKLEDYNKIMRARGTPEKCIPRTLLLIDEFQVMFTQVEPKTVEKIQVQLINLAKLGRSAGVHMFFTSQSMAGTMSKDVKDQFSLRIALRCSADVSEELIGSKISSTITAKFGYMYSNTNAGAEQESTTLWRSPFLPDEDWFNTEGKEKQIAAGKAAPGSLCILDELAKMVKERGEIDRKAKFYDSKEHYGQEVLEQWYAGHADVVESNPGVCVVGERTDFSTKTVPVNFMFRRSDAENLILYAREDMDLCNLIRTLMLCLKSDPRNLVIANSADEDYYNMCELAEVVGPSMAKKARPTVDPSDWLDFLEGAIAGRKSKGMEGKKPIYFFAVRWDKQQGIYRGEDYKMAGRWKQILMDGPAVDIHIILCCALYKEIKNADLPLFNHGICGQGEGDAGYKFIESSKIANLYESDDSPVAIYKYGQSLTKFKIYQFTYKSQFSSRELDF